MDNINDSNSKKAQIKKIIEQAKKEGKSIDWTTIVLC